MLIEIGMRALPEDFPATVVCIGTFDGVHRGHQEVIRATVNSARSKNLVPALVTFDRNPLEVIAPDRAPLAVSSWEQNLEIAEGLGIALARVIPFDAEVRSLSHDAFLQKVLRAGMHAKHAVVGYDFAMGKDRAGNAEWLSQHIPTQIIPPYLMNGVRVSSTEVRESIVGGDLDRAELFLDRPFSMDAVVGTGDQIGRKLGFPTLNLFRGSNLICPGDGVYAGFAQTVLGQFKAAVSVGTRETFGEKPRLVEAFLLDYPGESLYGTSVRLTFLKKVRNQVRFDSSDQLQVQMQKDISLIRELLADKGATCSH